MSAPMAYARLVGVELDKLRTVRAPLLLLAAAQLLVVAGVSGLVISGGDLRAGGTVPKALGHAGLAALITLVLGIVMMAGEYRNRTVTDTYLSTPRRGRVVLAKTGAAAVAGAVFGVANVVTALVATSVWWAAKGVSLSLSDPEVWRTVVGCVLWNIGFAVIGVGVGALVRNLTAAVAVALAWLALVEGIVGQLVGGLARWLPFADAARLGDAGTSAGTVGTPGQVGAGLVLAAYAALFAVVAVSTTVRRDVS